MPFFFTLNFLLPDEISFDPEMLLDRLYEAGCDDAIFAFDKLADRKLVADFTRDAPSRSAAVETAIADVEKAIPGCSVVRLDDIADD